MFSLRLHLTIHPRENQRGQGLYQSVPQRHSLSAISTTPSDRQRRSTTAFPRLQTAFCRAAERHAALYQSTSAFLLDTATFCSTDLASLPVHEYNFRWFGSENS